MVESVTPIKKGRSLLKPAPAALTLRFGVFEVNLAAGELRKHGLKIKLQEQPFQILTMLLEAPGRGGHARGAAG